MVRQMRSWSQPWNVSLQMAYRIKRPHLFESVIRSGRRYEVGPFEIEPFSIPHDAREPVGLVVEDEADLRTSLVELLSIWGYRVSSACDGHEALERLRAAQEPVLMLLDLQMPVMTGDQLLARPIPGKWSTQEVVCHLADYEPIYADRMKRVIALQEPELLPGDPGLFAARLAYDRRDGD